MISGFFEEANKAVDAESFHSNGSNLPFIESVKDDECSEFFISELSQVSRDEQGELNELELCRLKKGQYAGMHVLTSHESAIQQRRSCSLYTASAKDCLILVIKRETYHRAVLTCQNRIRNEKSDFLRSVELLKPLKRNSIKNLTRFLVKRNITRH